MYINFSPLNPSRTFFIFGRLRTLICLEHIVNVRGVVEILCTLVRKNDEKKFGAVRWWDHSQWLCSFDFIVCNYICWCWNSLGKSTNRMKANASSFSFILSSSILLSLSLSLLLSSTNSPMCASKTFDNDFVSKCVPTDIGREIVENFVYIPKISW